MIMRTTAGASALERADAIVDGEIDYPDTDGEPMADSDQQLTAIMYLVTVLKNWFLEDVNVYVAGNLLIYYIEGFLNSFAPDVLVVFGANGNHPRRSWKTWEEGGALPSFVLEAGSRSTWKEDADYKRVLYAELGIEEFWRFDPLKGELFNPVLIGERLIDGEYRPIEVSLDESGVLRGYSEILGLDICVRPEDGELRLYDPINRQWLNSFDEEKAARLKERTGRLEAETAQREAEAEAQRLRELLAQLQPGE